MINFQSISTLVDLDKVVRQARTDISFWGWKHVAVVGASEERLPIDALAERMIEIVRQNPHFNEVERSSGKKVAQLISRIYSDCDGKLKEKNIFTRILAALRDYLPSWHLSSNVRACWEGGEPPIEDCHECGTEKNVGHNKIFEYYTKQQYQTVFQVVPDSHPSLSRDIARSMNISREMHTWNIYPARWRAPSVV